MPISMVRSEIFRLIFICKYTCLSLHNLAHTISLMQMFPTITQLSVEKYQYKLFSIGRIPIYHTPYHLIFLHAQN